MCSFKLPLSTPFLESKLLLFLLCPPYTHQAKVGFKIGAVPWTGAPFTCKYEGNVSEKVVITRLKRGALGFCCVTNAPEEIVIRLIKCSYPADFTPSLWHGLFILSKGNVVDVLVSSLWYLAGWLCVWHQHADGNGSHHVLHQLLGAEVGQTGTRWASLHAFALLWSQEMHPESIISFFL